MVSLILSMESRLKMRFATPVEVLNTLLKPARTGDNTKEVKSGSSSSSSAELNDLQHV